MIFFINVVVNKCLHYHFVRQAYIVLLLLNHCFAKLFLSFQYSSSVFLFVSRLILLWYNKFNARLVSHILLV